MQEAAATVWVRVELFGMPRMHCGTAAVELAVSHPADREKVIAALAERCPALVGRCLKKDLTGLEEGYVFNLNGLTFLGEGDFIAAAGDSLLLLSNQAGG